MKGLNLISEKTSINLLDLPDRGLDDLRTHHHLFLLYAGETIEHCFLPTLIGQYFSRGYCYTPVKEGHAGIVFTSSNAQI